MAGASKESLDALLIQKALDESRIRVVGAKDKKLVTKLRETLDWARAKPKPSAGSSFRWSSSAASIKNYCKGSIIARLVDAFGIKAPSAHTQRSQCIQPPAKQS